MNQSIKVFSVGFLLLAIIGVFAVATYMIKAAHKAPVATSTQYFYAIELVDDSGTQLLYNDVLDLPNASTTPTEMAKLPMQLMEQYNTAHSVKFTHAFILTLSRM